MNFKQLAMVCETIYNKRQSNLIFIIIHLHYKIAMVHTVSKLPWYIQAAIFIDLFKTIKTLSSLIYYF